MSATAVMSAVAPRVAFARPRASRPRGSKGARTMTVQASGDSSGKATWSTDRALRGDRKVDLNRGEQMTYVFIASYARDRRSIQRRVSNPTRASTRRPPSPIILPQTQNPEKTNCRENHLRADETTHPPRPLHSITVPATSANMGPGFDSFGFAVDLENELILERGAFKVDIIGEGETSLPRDESNAIIKAVKDGYAAIYPDESLPMDDIKFTSINRIPPARGLGSSSAALVAGLAAGLALAGQDLAKPQTKQLLLQLAADAEGHPDNVAPAIYGGFQVSINTGKQWVTQAIGLPTGMQAVLFIPEFESLTSETRAALPKEIPVADAVFNISRAAMLINSFATDNFEALRYACQDVIHQPYRGAAFPMQAMIDAALGMGAHGAFLSGAGPTVLALTGGHGSDVDADTMATFLAVEVADAMLAAAKEGGCDGRAVISAPSPEGVRCSKRETIMKRLGKTSGSVF